MNKVVLIGRTTKNVDLKTTPSGKSVASFTLAVNRDYKNADGKYDADFINCVSFGQQAETISKYVCKGDKFGVTGKLNTRTYDKNGSKVYVTEVIVDGFEFLESRQRAADVEYDTADFAEIDSGDDLPF